jgi:glycosyltransferase involved in cell wall biosynthesis
MFYRLGQLLAFNRPSLVLTYNWGSIEAVPAGFVAGRLPVIHAEDGFGVEEAVCQIPRRVLTRRVLLRFVFRAVAPSASLVDIMRDVWRLPEHKIEHIPNGIDLSCFSEISNRTKAGDPIVIGTVGHLRPEKRHDRLIAACAELSRSVPLRLIIAGDGSERPRLEEMVRLQGIGDRVRFLGHQADINTVYRQMDVFALSSATEQMPLSVLEAMACGLPVVSTDVGDVRKMVSSENGPLITTDEGMVAALHKIAADPRARASIGRANRLHCRRTYDISKMFERYAVLYESAIKSTHVSAARCSGKRN